jgi:RNA polymerase sigma factor (sigma-70 family)
MDVTQVTADAYLSDPLDEEATATDLVRTYLTDIGRVRLLNAAEEVELAKRIEAGLYAAEVLRHPRTGGRRLSARTRVDLAQLVTDGERAKRALLEANLRLVVSLAKRYQGKGVPLLDLVQEGNIGLVRAVEKFDFAKGYKFSTYATWWIRQALQRAIADQGHTIRIPVHMAERINKLLRIKRNLETQLGRDPSLEEIATAAGMAVTAVDEALHHAGDTVSLDQPVGDEGEAVLADFVDADTPDPADVVAMTALHQQLDEMLDQLPDRAARVLRLRFGLLDGQPRTLAEVGEELELTRERVRQIERDTLAILREAADGQQLRAFVA